MSTYPVVVDEVQQVNCGIQIQCYNIPSALRTKSGEQIPSDHRLTIVVSEKLTNLLPNPFSPSYVGVIAIPYL